MPEKPKKIKDPLNGITLEQMLTEMVVHLGWEGMAERIRVHCFQYDPSIKSSLKFLRKTPWARLKVETYYRYESKKWKREEAKVRAELEAANPPIPTPPPNPTEVDVEAPLPQDIPSPTQTPVQPLEKPLPSRE